MKTPLTEDWAVDTTLARVTEGAVVADPVSAPQRIAGNGRLLDIERGKGLAIALVVLGHISRTAPEGNAWYGVLKNAIYFFHMPFFMFLSGFTMYYVYRAIPSFADYRAFVGQKFFRLMPAFFLFGIFILAGKIIAAPYVFIDNPPAGFISGAADILFRPRNSSAGSLWYIYVLFAYYALLPIALWVFRGRIIFILLLGIAVHWVPATDWFMLDAVAHYLVYLTIGFYVSQHYQQWTAFIDRFAWFLFALFAASIPLAMEYPITKTAAGLLSIPALHALVRMPWLNQSKVLLTLGAYTYSIYLLNTIVIGVVKGAALKFLPWGGPGFIVLMCVLLASGIVLPILIRRYVFTRFTWLEKITR